MYVEKDFPASSSYVVDIDIEFDSSLGLELSLSSIDSEVGSLFGVKERIY